MADNAVLQAERRSTSGKEMAKRLRGQDKLPAVVYGESRDAVPCTVDRKELEDLIHDRGRNVILSLVVSENAPENALIKEIQHHPLEGNILHVDFQRISLTAKIVVEVQIQAKGVPAGVRTDGGILEHMLHSVEVECLPTDIPQGIEVDVTPLNIGDTIHAADLVVPDGVALVTEGDRSVFVVVPPTVVKTVDEEAEEEGLEEEEESQEPEVIERGKRDEDEDEE
jgi:large subunit ribosomal protein L25